MLFLLYKLQVYIVESAEPTPCIKLLHVLHRSYSWLLLAIGRLYEMSKVVARVVGVHVNHVNCNQSIKQLPSYYRTGPGDREELELIDLIRFGERM